jgi:hypothetical protein
VLNKAVDASVARHLRSLLSGSAPEHERSDRSGGKGQAFLGRDVVDPGHQLAAYCDGMNKNLGRLSSAALMLAGVAGVLVPERVGAALDVPATSPRGQAETRAGLGGTYAALGAYGLFSRSPGAQRAVGATWLGAAVARVGALKADKPNTDWTYWAYLAAETILGTSALLSARD